VFAGCSSIPYSRTVFECLLFAIQYHTAVQCLSVFWLQEKQKRDEALERDEIYRTPTPTPEDNATWLQIQDLEVRTHTVNPSEHLI